MDAVKGVEAGVAVPDTRRALGISTATVHKWPVEHGGIAVSMMSSVRELEDESRRLKKTNLEEKLNAEIVAEALEKVVRPSRRRELARKAVTERGLCIRLA
jgi:putative transposase